jgi:hypothetical protein
MAALFDILFFQSTHPTIPHIYIPPYIILGIRNKQSGQLFSNPLKGIITLENKKTRHQFSNHIAPLQLMSKN